jgi:Fic family protein
LFIYLYVRKEALLSSQIEGTQSSLSDLLLFESERVPGVPLDDVQEVSNYVAAINHGLKRLREGFPLSLRLINEIHKVLLAKGRGSSKQPGEFRKTQNWIGGTRPGTAVFVPPPPDKVMVCMSDLEKFLHGEPEPTPTLIKAALAHVQFETIHPFLDGNGRLGRLLMTLLLCAEKVLVEPVLYLSLYFKTNRERYYHLLQDVRLEGDWEAWVRFFLEGVRLVATQAVEAARKVIDLFESDRRRIESLGRSAGSAHRVFEHMRRNPFASATNVADSLSLSFPTASQALKNLEKLGIVAEVTGRERDRLFSYQKYIDLLSEGTEPL